MTSQAADLQWNDALLICYHDMFRTSPYVEKLNNAARVGGYVMAGKVQFDVCPETGIGCVMLDDESGLLKIDLMPDETADLKVRLGSGDMDGAKAVLSIAEPRAEVAVDSAVLEDLAREVV